MDAKTAEIRYRRWVQAVQDWSSSGLSKRAFCQERGIDEKAFYYYQRRLRSLLADQAELQGLPEGRSEIALSASTGSLGARPQIVKLQFPGSKSSGDSLMVRFSVNGMDFSVPENIPAPFLAKLLEAACHGSR